MMLYLSFPFALPPPAGSLLFACLNQSPALLVGGCAGGRDDSVAGVVAYLLARGRFADAVSCVVSSGVAESEPYSSSVPS